MFAREGVCERSATYLGIRWVFIVIRFGTLACFLEENHAFQLLPWQFHRSHIQPSLRHSEGEGRGRGTRERVRVAGKRPSNQMPGLLVGRYIRVKIELSGGISFLA